MKIRHYLMRDVTVPDESGLRHTIYRRIPSDTFRVVHDGVTYDADDTGAFDVPDEVGAELCQRHGWVLDDGGVAEPAAAPDRVAELERQIAELRDLLAGQAKPARNAKA